MSLAACVLLLVVLQRELRSSETEINQDSEEANRAGRHKHLWFSCPLCLDGFKTKLLEAGRTTH